MALTEFGNWALGQGQVAKYTDGGFPGQCVSLINQYLGRVYGIAAGAWGDAKDWATNPNVAQYFDKVSSPQAGDIGVMGPNFGNGFGHIFIYLTPTTILEQNGRVPLKVSTGAAYANPIAILRRKGDSDMAWKETAEQLQVLATQAEKERDDWRATAEKLQGIATDQGNQIKALQAQVAEKPVNTDTKWETFKSLIRELIK